MQKIRKCLTAVCLLFWACTGGTSTDAEHKTMTNILITTANRTFRAQLYDTHAAQALAERLPLTLEMRDLNGNEKYRYMAEPLPEDAHHPGQINAGDLMLFGDNCLVLFYKSLHTSYGYTPLGRVTNAAGLAHALGNAAATVRIAKPDAKKTNGEK